MESDQSKDQSFPKIFKSLFKEINEINLLNNENNESKNTTKALTKKENNESTSTKTLIQMEIMLFILFCTIFGLVIDDIYWGIQTGVIVLFVLSTLTTLVILILEAYGMSIVYNTWYRMCVQEVLTQFT